MATKKPPVSKKSAPKKAATKTPKAKVAQTSTPKKPVSKPVKNTTPLKLPTKAGLEKLKQADTDFVLAQTNAVKFLESRRQAVFNIARPYHLDPEELFQEGYEILLTCLRDYTPVFERADGTCVSVKFTTFFGNRMDGRAMEMRNRNPEYQARAAMTQDMTPEEKTSFRENPPLLVQHLDLETPMQETLRGEASEAQEENAGNVLLKVIRDSFFEKKLNELVAKERDDKKRAILMHVKVGGVYSFQDVAFHFGVTDSRASQILNELMDAFYVQRLIDGDLNSVKYDFQKLKFNEKRAVRLIEEATQNAAPERQKEINATFTNTYETLPAPTAAPTITDQSNQEENVTSNGATPATPAPTTTYVPEILPFTDTFNDDENKKYPLLSVELRDINALKPQELTFRPTEDLNSDADAHELPHISAILDTDPHSHPLIVTEAGHIIDGNRRLAALKARGISQVMCMTRQVNKDADLKQLRIATNVRTLSAISSDAPDKTDLYYAISALLDTGLSQQKISKLIGISRTNVIVYAKVKEKAAPAIRQLFEDGLIQITNASSCVDLPGQAQTDMADFIRAYGSGWAKGSQFNTLYDAAAGNKIDALKAKQSPLTNALAPNPPKAGSALAVSNDAQLNKRVASYEQALKDAEIWTAQREGVITRQTNELVEARNQVDKLKRELEAAELIKYGDSKAQENAFKQLRQFYALTERLAAAQHSITIANKDIRGIDLHRKQFTELNTLIDTLEKELNTLRVEMLTKGRKL